MFYFLSIIIALSKMLHITDIHYDPYYTIGAPTQCVLGDTGLGCCHHFDIPISGSTPASKWGDYNCDVSPYFLNETLSWIQENEPEIDMILYTGDSVGHHDIINIPRVVKKSVSDIFNSMKEYFPNIPIYSNLGNHDTWPIDQTVFIEYNMLLKDFAHSMHGSLPDDILTQFGEGGYYTILLNENTRLISFNSIYYDSHNLFRNEINIQGDYQMRWLRRVLDVSRKRKEKVWFISHIFPTAGETTDAYNKMMSSLFWEYRDVIRYQWYGHSHNDQFILFQRNGNVYSSGVVTPSLMPDHRFPAFRVYTYDKDTYTLLDYTQYKANLTDIQIKDTIHYQEDYTFTTLYRKKGLETSDYQELHKDIQFDNQTYCTHFTPGRLNCHLDILIHYDVPEIENVELR